MAGGLKAMTLLAGRKRFECLPPKMDDSLPHSHTTRNTVIKSAGQS